MRCAIKFLLKKLCSRGQKFKSYHKWVVFYLALFIGSPSIFASTINLERLSGSYEPTVFGLDRIVEGIVRLIYKPFALTLRDKIFAFQDIEGKTVYLAHEYFWDLEMKSTVTLYEVNLAGASHKIGVIRDVSGSSSGLVEILNEADVLVARGVKKIRKRNVLGLRFYDKNKEVLASVKANSKTRRYSIDIVDEKLISPLLIASFIAFDEHRSIRRQNATVVVATAGIAGGLVLGNYFFGERISRWFFSEKNWPTIFDDVTINFIIMILEFVY